jgi:acyl-CoA dehydrogenase
MRDMLEQSIERLLAGAVSPELLIAAQDGVWPAELWAQIEDGGFTLALASQEAGGAGAGWADAFTLFRAVGRHAAPAPFAETAIANWVLGECGLPLAEGPVTLAVSTIELKDGGASGRLTGAAWGRHCGHVLTVGPQDTVLLFPTLGLKRVEGLNLAGEPRDDFLLDGVAPAASAPLPGHLPSDVLLRAGAITRAAQIAGGLQQALDLSIRYAEDRSQFGRQIGKFQAVQQQLAVLAEHTSLALVAADAAFSADGLPELPVASAKIVAGEAATAGAAIAHAVHGAIGVTYEHSLHFTTRRLWAWRSEYGSERYWAERLGRAVAAQPADAFWPALSHPLAMAGATSSADPAFKASRQ